MRKEYTRTSPQHLFPERNHYHSPYLSPKNQQQPSFNSFKSPSQQQQDDLQQKYPISYKYNARVQNSSKQQQQQFRSPQGYHSPQHSSAIEISQLKLTINQLRNSLQVCTENSQRIQEELFLQRSKNIELMEVRGRMEQEFKRMEFELDRITNYEALETRESSIKLQNAVRENSRLAIQVGDLIEEIKSLKLEQRKRMSECDRLLQEKQTLLRQNECLLQKLESLQDEVRAVKREVAHQSQQSLRIKSDMNIPSRVNNINTVRTNQASTIINSHRNIASRQSIDLEQLPEEIDYEQENKKLLEDYQRLIEENESMKQLYNNFYKNDSSDPVEKVVSLHHEPSDFHQSFSNRKIVEQMNSSPRQNDLMLKTMQKKELVVQVSEVRDTAISELLKVYDKTVDRSKKEHKNCLKLFIHELSKNKVIYSQMAQNYLQIRSTIEQEAGIKIPNKITEIPTNGDKQAMIVQIYKSVKQKAKGEKDIGICLAIFRLLTLLSKSTPLSPNLMDNLKHSILKFVYKLQNKRVDTQQ